MKVKMVPACVGVALWWALAVAVCAQDTETKYRSADTNNAVIEGRVTLPSGFAADRNVKIIFKNSLSTLSVLYTNKHGEFQINNLSEGVYYVQAEVDDRSFEPVVQKIELGRGIIWELTLQLREKQGPQVLMSVGTRVISAAELRQTVPPAAKKEYGAGLKLVTKGDIVQAAAHYHLARIYLDRGDSAEATRSIRAYLKEAPNGEYVREARLLEKRLGGEAKH